MLIMEKENLRKDLNSQIRKNIRTFEEKENYKKLGILEADIIKQAEMKEKK